MIKNIIFDIGLVLVNWHPVLDSIFDKQTAEVVQGVIFESGLWEYLDHGLEDDEIVFEEMIRKAPEYREQIMYILNHLHRIAEQYDYAKSWIQELKDLGYHVYYLSNYSRHLRKTEPELTDFVPMMDGGIFSADVKLVKPDPKIYELLCSQYNLVPAECLFIDDRQENVEAAIRCGMKAIRFDGYGLSYDEIMLFLAYSLVKRPL